MDCPVVELNYAKPRKKPSLKIRGTQQLLGMFVIAKMSGGAMVSSLTSKKSKKNLRHERIDCTMSFPVIELSYSKPIPKPTLTKFRTRELMAMMEIARGNNNVYPFWLGYGWTLDEFKVELATREHIPNKEEARKIRQEKAKAKRNR
jgi:hypothetical protein